VKLGYRRSIGQLDISVDGDKIPLTLRGLASCHLSADILHNIRKCVTSVGTRRLRRLKGNGARRCSMEHSTEGRRRIISRRAWAKGYRRRKRICKILSRYSRRTPDEKIVAEEEPFRCEPVQPAEVVAHFNFCRDSFGPRSIIVIFRTASASNTRTKTFTDGRCCRNDSRSGRTSRARGGCRVS